ncbi:phosphatase PAP2 family protein [Mucilaginibacter lappiensis]|uniref:Membrane-associated phospholipid phosphatase n=1 Tax=Mucilaginibacter lappiensis TaxID=354630 RepID=A0A841JBL4_9SPHI|nr:phosphatase PAP2 family protein [Mucilaginibacter lappiensis]MBB6125968.1 membrane-associated phospholipid phosphatase [Mucilaginibacter lappiensis]
MIKDKRLFLFFIWLFVFINPGRSLAQNLDVDILKSINPRYPTSLYWRNTSNSAYYVAGAASFGTLIYGLASNNAAVKRNATETFINLGASVLVTQLIKISVNRTRPADRYPDEIFVNSPTHNQSFPSGHTSLAFATATTLSMQYKKWYVTVPAYAWASSVAYSRMYLGKHYPTDVLAGAAVGIGSAYAGRWFNQKLFKQYQKPKKYD